jgi:hypothetical protein
VVESPQLAEEVELLDMVMVVLGALEVLAMAVMGGLELAAEGPLETPILVVQGVEVLL